MTATSATHQENDEIIKDKVHFSLSDDAFDAFDQQLASPAPNPALEALLARPTPWS